MKQVDITFPDSFPTFSTTLSVRVSDVNYGGHLGNDAVLSMAHEARIRFLDDLGYSETDVGGAGLIMLDAEVRYLEQSSIGEKLTIEVGAGGMTSRGFDVFFRIRKSDDDQRVAEARTGMLGYHYDRERVASLPEPFQDDLITRNEA